jgi:hypothetical protein
MSYVYLLELHRRIDRRLAKARRSAENPENDSATKRFHDGRIEILAGVKKFLTEDLNPGLPRRIRESHFGKR